MVKDLQKGTLPLDRDKSLTLKGGLHVPNICASFEQAVIDVLIAKTIKAAKEYRLKTIMLSGGVAANQELRKQFQEKLKKEKSSFRFQVPGSKFCTDNAVMIAVAAYYKILGHKIPKQSNIQSQANLPLL